MRHLLNRTALVLIGAAMILTSAPAEENKVELKEIEVENEVELEEIAVTATRAERSSFDIPNAVSSVSLEEFQRRMPISLVDALIDGSGRLFSTDDERARLPVHPKLHGLSHSHADRRGAPQQLDVPFRSEPVFQHAECGRHLSEWKSCAARVLFYTAIRQSAALSTRFRAAPFFMKGSSRSRRGCMRGMGRRRKIQRTASACMADRRISASAPISRARAPATFNQEPGMIYI